MEHITFRLTDNNDPEERVEEAVLWKVLHDLTGGKVRAVSANEHATFGRLLRIEQYAQRPPLNYWDDPAFLENVQRKFSVHDLLHAKREVARLHRAGYDAFVKSTRDKHAIFKCPIGESLEDAMGDMIYSFIDGGPSLMVQQWVEMRFEWRFFCINRKIVTHSNIHPSLTPLDHPLHRFYVKPTSTRSVDVHDKDIVSPLRNVAEKIASQMKDPTAIIDCAYIEGVPGCVELNPFHLGSAGLYACDVRALVKAVLEGRGIL